MKVVVLGAAGNLAPCIVAELEKEHTVRLTDVKPVDTQHESFLVNVTSAADVRRAIEGMEAVVDLTVLRDDPRLSFDVNVWGAYNVCQACVENGVRRLVHTGPVLGAGPYRGDFGIDENVPPHPGTTLYPLTKYLAEEVCRSFADTYGLTVVGIRLSGIFQEKVWPHPLFFGQSVCGEDLGQAVCLALTAENLPSHFEVFNIFCDSPVNTYPIDKAKRLLGFRPKFNYEEAWKRR